MSLFKRDRPGRKRTRSTSPARDSAAREKRARDHLARKRRVERERLERERGRADASEQRALMRGVLAPILFFGAIVLGMATAQPISERLLLRPALLERIAVQGASALSPETIARGAGVVAGRSLDGVDPARVRESVTAEPWIESARALRLPDGTLVISVVERAAIARFRPSEEERIELVDPEGDRFAGSLSSGGPLPLVQGRATESEPLPRAALEILNELGRYASLAIDPSSLTLHLPGVQASAEGALVGSQTGYVLQIGEAGPRALLGQRRLRQRIARLAALLESQETTLSKARLIDLRYADRAVLRTEPASG